MSLGRESDPRPFSYQENVLPLNYLGKRYFLEITQEYYCNKGIGSHATQKSHPCGMAFDFRLLKLWQQEGSVARHHVVIVVSYICGHLCWNTRFHLQPTGCAAERGSTTLCSSI